MKFNNYGKRVDEGGGKPYGVYFEIEQPNGQPQRVWIANDADWPDARHYKRPVFLFSFGEYGWTKVVVLGSAGVKYLEQAMEAAADWVAEMAPGIASDPEYPENVEELEEEEMWEAIQEAETDLTNFGDGPNGPIWINSWEWTVDEFHEGDDLWERSLSAAEENSDDDAIADTAEDIEAILDERANLNLVVGLSRLGDIAKDYLEGEGYDSGSAVAVAASDDGGSWAVNSDLITEVRHRFGLDPHLENGAMLWGERDKTGRRPIDALMENLSENGYEIVESLGGHWPTGEEAEIDVDSVAEQANREYGHSQAATLRALRKIFRTEDVGDLVYWTSSSGDTEVYAQLKRNDNSETVDP